tara:strand:- start:1962 stop:2108 length:147 start_codon:yes stop_codon:yes gene_type:complete
MKTTRCGFSKAPKQVVAKRSEERNDLSARFMREERVWNANKGGDRKVA